MKQKILLVSPQCPSCEALKKFLEGKGWIQHFKVLDITTTQGLDFAKRLGVSGVPECAIIEGDGRQKTVRICSDDEWQTMLEGK